MEDSLLQYVSVVPNANQKHLEKMGFYAFVHFGMNTFYNREWGDGKEDPRRFCPTDLDTDQWCDVLRRVGARGVILTAKHHDGFCLWPTATTEHCIRNSPYKDGKGDIVAELAQSCRKFGLELGLYLSPWDRNADCYGSDAYNDFYCAQLEELLTGYGPLFTVWLDGACGSYMDGKPVQKYDFGRYFDLIHRLQPDCAISNCGPDVRWVGNEAGICRASEWNVVPAFQFDLQKVQDNSQQQADGFAVNVDVVSEDLGSREVLSHFDRFIWYPAEVDVSIRRGWFYHPNQKPRSVNNLLNIYYASVGGNCMLLLNIPPDCRGRIADADVKRLDALAARIDSAFAHRIEIARADCPDAKDGMSWQDMQTGGTYSPRAVADTYRIEMRFDRPYKADKVVLAEDIDYSQRIERYAIYAIDGARERCVYRGTTVGHKKIALFRPTVCDGLAIVVEQCRLEPYLETVEVYETDNRQPRQNPFGKLIRWIHKLNYQVYVARTERAKAREAKKGGDTNK